MPLLIDFPSASKPTHQAGVSLVELIAFIVIVSIALLALVRVYEMATAKNTDPLIRMRALEAAQSKLDEILSLKYDQNTPSGGVPACSSAHAGSVACDNTTDSNMDDVDDFHGRSDTPYTGYNRTVTVSTNSNIKVISVSVSSPNGETITLAAERANF